MKSKYILLIAILLVCSISVWGQTKKSTSANSTKAIAEKVQMLESYTQEQFVQLQNENKALKEQLQKMESDIAFYREDVKTETSRMNTNMALWLTVLTIVMSLIGILAPILINLWNNNLQKEKIGEITNQLKSASSDAKAAKEDADSAKKSLSDVENLKNEITSIKKIIEDSEKAAKKSADEAKSSKLFAEALAESEKNPQKAIELYTKVIQCDNKNVGAYNNRGNLYMKLGKTEIAIVDYNKAIEIAPHDAGGYNNRANLWLKQHQYDKALEDVNRAISLEKNNCIYHITKGEIYMAMKNYNDAINAFSYALTLKDNVKEAYKFRGECYRELAKVTKSNEKGIEYNALAESDEKKYEELDKKSNG